MPGVTTTDSACLAALERATNRRQAAKIMDVDSIATLVLTFASGRRVYVRNTDAGLYAVGYGSGGGLYLSRVLKPGRVTAMATNAAAVDVEHDYAALPDPICHPSDGGDGA